MYRILILGGGYLGSAMGGFFADKKQKVWAVVRTERRVAELEARGIRPILADLTRPETLTQLPPAQFVMISVAPHIRDEGQYRKVYYEGVKNYLATLDNQIRPVLIVYVSSIGVWEQDDGSWVDEPVPAAPLTARAQILLDTENLVLGSGYPAAVLRLAGIYGPGRNRLEALRQGAWPQPCKDRYINLIHRDDIVQAMPLFLKKAEAGRTYVGTDDEPVLYSELYRWLAAKTGSAYDDARILRQETPGGKRCRNTKLKSLGIALKYPTFREGYNALLEKVESR